MNGSHSILVGMDLANDFTQLCCYSSRGELYSVSLGSDPQKYRIPTALCAMYGSGDWLYGEEALNARESETCLKITDIVNAAETGEKRLILGHEYSPDMLLERFFRRIFAAMRNKTGFTDIAGLTVTVRRNTPQLRESLYSALEPLGLRPDRIRVISHLESFMYYVVSQEKGIWISDVGLFDFERDGMVLYRLSFGRRQEPLTVVAEKIPLDDTVTYDMLGVESAERLAYAFENTASMALGRLSMSSVFFTGPGFESSWADQVLKGLCSGRRVFRGQNLYVKGAGYACRLYFDGGIDNYKLVGDGMLRSGIAMRVYANGHYTELPLVSIGDDYRAAVSETEVILDDTNELDFVVHNVLKKDFVCAIMTLDGLTVRPDRSVRVRVSLRFADRESCIITVRDTGFGEIYDTNHRIWEQILKV